MAAPKPTRFHRVWIKIRRGPKRGHYRRGWALNTPAPSWRDHMRADMEWAVANTAQIHYRQERPIRLDAIRDRRLPIVTDCSGSTTMLDKSAGLPDPNGQNYDTSKPMFTGTIRATLRRIPLADANTGDKIIYGTGDGDHVVVIDKPHPTNPVVFSHGQEAGPWFITHAQEVAAHGGYFTVHSGAAS